MDEVCYENVLKQVTAGHQVCLDDWLSVKHYVNIIKKDLLFAHVNT